MNKIFLLVLMFAFHSEFIQAQSNDSAKTEDPLYKKPFLVNLSHLQLGGYTDVSYEVERESGITEEATFKANRFNLFAYSRLFNRATIFAEIEFEEGGGEISLEIGQFDFEFTEALNIRAGVLLPPLGRFNVNHDSPKNNFTRRPLVSTEIIPSTLSEVGGGLFGNIYIRKMRLNYNLYLTNGFNDGLILNSAGKTSFQAGSPSLGEDNNTVPSFTGRLGFLPSGGIEAGISFHTGTYNKYVLEGKVIDEKRNELIIAADWGLTRSFKFGTLGLSGEFAYAKIDLPASLIGLYASKQQGFYVDLTYDFLRGFVKILPKSSFIFALRYDEVHLDKDITGDLSRQFSLGLNFKPFEDSIFKINYTRGWSYDRQNNLTHKALITASIATYF